MNSLLVPKIEEQKTEKRKKIINKKTIEVFIVILIAMLALNSINWLYDVTGNITLDQMIFHLKVPLEGTNSDMICEYILDTFPISICIALVTAIILNHFKDNKIIRHAEKIIFTICIVYIFSKTHVIAYLSNQITASNFIEENYVAVEMDNIIFPEQKNNLIYIFLESMESSYTDIEHGGMNNDDYIKELREIAENNIHFSNTEKLGGAYQLPGSGWTIAGMVSQTSGLPLKISIEQNSYGKYDTFLPGVTNIGEILEYNDYTNYLLVGSDSSFGGRKNYFTQHGNYQIWDYNSAIEEGRMTEEDKVWWGYDDNNLFTYAKEQLLEISKNDKPFNFTLLTVDTHFVDGYVCEKCTNQYDSQYANVISCSSRQVSEFIDWIKKQDFYENTTIIISGDHLTMQVLPDDTDIERSVFNTIINPSKSLDISNINTTNRIFATIDMFPTTLAALGAKIKDNKLSLGTNLFSNEDTLFEKYGVEVVNSEIDKKSKFYDQKFIYGK